MLFNFDLQMFNDDSSIPGIDADVLEQFKDELPQAEEATEPTEQKEEAADADTHSDNKEEQQQQTQQEEEEEVQEGSSIPYSRFKSINDRMKTSEARVQELEAEIARMKSTAPAPQTQQQESPAPEAKTQAGGEEDFNAEQLQLMAAEARRRAAQKLNLTQDDIENMEYQDDPNVKTSYDALTAQYMGEVRKEAVEYVNAQKAYVNDINTTSAEYQRLVGIFNADPKRDEKWAAVSAAALKRGERFAQAAQAAINRLDQNKGTSGDFFLVKNFMDSVLGEDWASSKPATPPPAQKQNKKIQEAAKLPTAPSVGGATKGDLVWDATTIADYINSGKMDEIPPDILKKVMGQSLAPADVEE